MLVSASVFTSMLARILPTGEMDNAVADWLAAIDACSTLEELKDVYMKATAAVGSHKEINAATNAKKASLK